MQIGGEESEGEGDGGDRRTIVVTNVFSDDNRGGAAITAATVATIEEAFPGCQVTLVAVIPPGEPIRVTHRHTAARFPEVDLVPSALPQFEGRLAGLRTVLISLLILLLPRTLRINEALTRIAKSDLVVSKGGHVFVERGGFRRVLALWATAWPLLYAHRLGIPTVAFCTSVGPFRTWLSKLVNGFILRRITLVMARDPLSRRAALRVGVAADRVVEVPDSAFRIEPPTPERIDEIANEIGLPRKNFGVVTFRSIGNRRAQKRLLDAFAGAVRDILDREIAEEIAIVVQVDGPTTSDADGSRELMELVGDRRVRLVRQDLSPEKLIALYGAASFLIGCRMHSTIFAMVAGTPAVAISLEGEKVRGVYESLGLADLVVPLQTVEAQVLIDLVRRIVDDGDQLRERVARAVERSREQTETLSDLLRQVEG